MLNKLKSRLWVWYTLIKQFKLFKWFLNVSPMLLMCSILYPLQRWPNVAPILDMDKFYFLTPIEQTRYVNCTLFFETKMWHATLPFHFAIFLSNLFSIKFICYLLFLKWPQRPYYGEQPAVQMVPAYPYPYSPPAMQYPPQLHMWHHHINLCTRQICNLNGSWSLHW